MYKRQRTLHPFDFGLLATLIRRPGIDLKSNILAMIAPASPEARCGRWRVRRPPSNKIAAVEAAAVIVRAERGATSKPAIVREVTARFADALTAYLGRDLDHELDAALAAVE